MTQTDPGPLNGPKIEPQVSLAESRRLLLPGVYLLMLAYSVSVTMIGPLMPELIRQYGLRLSEGGLIMTAQSVGGMLAIAVGAVLADRVHKGFLIAGSFAFYVISLFLAATAPRYPVLLSIFFLLGASTRLVDTVNNAFTADLNPGRRDVALNLLHTVFGIGALLGPIFVGVLLSRGLNWSVAYGYLGMACLAALIFFGLALAKSSLPPKDLADPVNAGPENLLRSTRMWLLCLIMVMYVGHQIGLVSWLPMYLQEFVGVDSWWGSLSLSVLWIGVILGRLICSRITRRIGAKSIIVWGALISGLLLLVSFTLGDLTAIIAAVGTAGLLTGAVIPLLVNIGCTWFPQNSGTVSSMIFFSGSVATMVFPWFMGWVAEFFGFGLAISSTGLTLLAIFALGRLVQI